MSTHPPARRRFGIDDRRGPPLSRPATTTPVWLLALLLAACSGDDGPSAPTTPPPTPVTVSVTPTSLTLVTGQTETITATVTGADAATLAFSSSNTGVATVTNTGLVTAVSPGSATVTAASGSATATTLVTVNELPLSVTLEGFSKDGVPISDLTSLSGAISATVTISDDAFTGTLEILFDDVVMASREIAPPAAAHGPASASGAARRRTETVEVATGAVTRVDESWIGKLQNGQDYEAGARLTSSRGASVESDPLGGLRTQNEPVFVITQVGQAGGLGARGPDGNFYRAGTQSLTGELVTYGAPIDPGDIAEVEVLKDNAATSIYGNRGANGVIVITLKHDVPFEEGGVKDVEGRLTFGPEVTFMGEGPDVSFPLGNGDPTLFDPGDPAVLKELWVDNVGPQVNAPVLPSGLALNTSTDFATQLEAFGIEVVDDGVGGGRFSLDLTLPDQQNGEWLYPDRVTGSGLPETYLAAQWRGTDALNNVDYQPVLLEGGINELMLLDGTRPLTTYSIGMSSVLDGQVNPTGMSLTYAVTDPLGPHGTASGADLTGMDISAVVSNPDGSQCAFGDADDCGLMWLSFDLSTGLDYFDIGEGEYLVRGLGRDEAVNPSEDEVALRYGLDITNPDISGTPSLEFLGGLDVRISSFNATDNLEVSGVGATYTLTSDGTPFERPFFAGYKTVGMSFDGSFETQYVGDIQSSIIQSLETTLPNGAPSGEAFMPSELEVAAFDHAGHFSNVFQDVSDLFSARPQTWDQDGVYFAEIVTEVGPGICDDQAVEDCGGLPPFIDLTAAMFTTNQMNAVAYQFYLWPAVEGVFAAQPGSGRSELFIDDVGGGITRGAGAVRIPAAGLPGNVHMVAIFYDVLGHALKTAPVLLPVRTN